ncbi:MAG: hypothetical protein AAB434_11810 [Planctomycetota bacterium]
MNNHFVCAWESVRPVPRVEIDFGDGHHMTRTLNGNVITFLCAPDGKVFDVLPGLYSAEGYLAGLRRSAELYDAMTLPALSPETFAERVAAYHRLAAEGVAQIAVEANGRVKADAGEMRYASKAMVEEPLKVLMAGMLDTPEVRFAAAELKNLDLGEFVAVSKTGIERPVKLAISNKPIEFAAKTSIEQPVKLAISNEAQGLLAMDTRINERLRAEQIHAMLLTAPLPAPADLSTRIYEEVLHVAVSDPHLGLGRVLFGAEGETR